MFEIRRKGWWNIQLGIVYLAIFTRIICYAFRVLFSIVLLLHWWDGMDLRESVRKRPQECWHGQKLLDHWIIRSMCDFGCVPRNNLPKWYQIYKYIYNIYIYIIYNPICNNDVTMLDCLLCNQRTQDLHVFLEYVLKYTLWFVKRFLSRTIQQRSIHQENGILNLGDSHSELTTRRWRPRDILTHRVFVNDTTSLWRIRVETFHESLNLWNHGYSLTFGSPHHRLSIDWQAWVNWKMVLFVCEFWLEWHDILISCLLICNYHIHTYIYMYHCWN